MRSKTKQIWYMADYVKGHFLPDLAWLVSVKKGTLYDDFWAAFTGACVVLPQGIAFAAIAGLPPEYGLYAAMVCPIIAAVFGSSWHLVSGPTIAISVVVYSSLSGQFTPGSPEFIQAALTMTLLAGIVQIALALAGLGQFVSFVSHSVMMGFTAGAAILIIMSQIPIALGLNNIPDFQFDQIGDYYNQDILSLSLASLFIAAVTLVSALVIKKKLPAWPNYLIALILGSLTAFAFKNIFAPLSYVAPVSVSYPQLVIPQIGFVEIETLSSSAMAIAMIGLLEAVSISKAIALKSRQKLNIDREMVGQGMSNLIGPFFSAYMASGSFTRSALNLDSGAKTPLAAILSGPILFILIVIFAPLIKYIPLPSMAALILLVAWRLINFKEIRFVIRRSVSETCVVAVTLSAVILVNMEFAIYAGVILSLFIFLRTTISPGLPVNAPDPNSPHRNFRNPEYTPVEECPQTVFTRLQGSLYFGSVDALAHEFRDLEERNPDQKHLVIVIDGSNVIDLAGAELLIEESLRRRQNGGDLYLVVRYPKLRNILVKYHVHSHLGPGHIFRRKSKAIPEVMKHLDPEICKKCQKRIFSECQSIK